MFSVSSTFQGESCDAWTPSQAVSGVTLPETNIFAPENRPKPNRKRSYSNHPFSGAMFVSGRVGVVFPQKLSSGNPLSFHPVPSVLLMKSRKPLCVLGTKPSSSRDESSQIICKEVGGPVAARNFTENKPTTDLTQSQFQESGESFDPK